MADTKTKTQPWPGWVWLLIGAAGVWGIGQWKGDAPGPVNPPAPTITQATAKVFPTLKREYSALCKEAAGLVRNKTLTNEEALVKWLKPKTEAARSSAFADFYNKMDVDVPTSFDKKEEDVAKYLEQISAAW